MSAKNNLVAAYGSWEKLTQTEGAAIEREDWPKVSECQQSKQGLQKQIIHLTEAAQAECIEIGQDPKAFERDMRRIINTLISLESRNAELLAGRKQAAEARKLELEQSAHNLRRVQKSYAPPTGALWNSYS
jgi:Tfp pilus assembly protein PilE